MGNTTNGVINTNIVSSAELVTSNINDDEDVLLAVIKKDTINPTGKKQD